MTDTKTSAKGAKEVGPGGLSLADGQMGDAALQRLRIGRALEALLEKNLLGKLDDHEARLSRQLHQTAAWLECQKQARVDFQARQGSVEAIDIDALREPPHPKGVPVAPPAKDAGGATPILAAAKGSESAHTAERLAEASARGAYVPASVREARKLEAQAYGGSANTVVG